MIFELCVREAKALELPWGETIDHPGSFFGVTCAEGAQARSRRLGGIFRSSKSASRIR